MLQWKGGADRPQQSGRSMKKTVCLGILAVVSGLSAILPQRAWAREEKPQPTTPGYIAVLFHKLSGRTPDFESWARNTEEYQAAASFSKPSVQERKVQDFRNIYNLLSFQEPLIVDMPVTLSDYSARNKGFLVESFREDTFFSSRYNDQSYAVIPVGIMDRQWLKVPDPDAAAAIAAAARNGKDRPLVMVLTLSPKYADSATPAVLYGESHWLMSAEIKRMTLYAHDSGTPLWQSGEDDDAKRRELLKLRQ